MSVLKETGDLGHFVCQPYRQKGANKGRSGAHSEYTPFLSAAIRFFTENVYLDHVLQSVFYNLCTSMSPKTKAFYLVHPQNYKGEFSRKGNENLLLLIYYIPV